MEMTCNFIKKRAIDSMQCQGLILSRNILGTDVIEHSSAFIHALIVFLQYANSYAM